MTEPPKIEVANFSTLITIVSDNKPMQEEFDLPDFATPSKTAHKKVKSTSHHHHSHSDKSSSRQENVPPQSRSSHDFLCGWFTQQIDIKTCTVNSALVAAASIAILLE